jgi:hypothetical protein
MSKVKFYAGDQEIRMPEKGRGESVFGAIPEHLRREEKPRDIKPSPIRDAIVAVIDHEELGGIAHVNDIQSGLHHLHGMSYKTSPLYQHLANAVKAGRIFKVEAKRGFYSTTPIAASIDGVMISAEASADFNEDEGFDEHDEHEATPIVEAKPAVRQGLPKSAVPGVQRPPLAVGRNIR